PQIELEGATAETVWMLINLDRIKLEGQGYKDWSFAYPIKLRSEDLSEAQIDKMQGISEEVREILRLKARDRTAAVRNVMLDFEHSSTEAFDAGRSRHEGATRETLTSMGLHKAFSQYFRALRSWENTYSLSFFVEDLQHSQQAHQPTFVPGKGVYSVQPPGGGKAGSLDLLLMRKGQSQLPEARSFDRKWAGDGQSDGRLTISWRLFLQDWLLPQVRNSLALGNRPFRFLDVDGTGHWGIQTYDEDEEEQWKGIDRYEWLKIQTSDFWVDTGFESGSDKTTKAIVKLEGQWYELIQVERKALGGGLWWSTCSLPLHGRIAIVAGTDGRLSFQADLNSPNAACTGEKDGLLIGLFNELGGNDIGSRLEGGMTNALDYLRALTGRAQVNLSKQLSESFLLPGGEQFFFKNARFDDDQNLVFDVTIKSQN
ncbi:MAG TPA: hypothetical protein VLV83_17715, partial [Acidobacteriota bacterium]|nr:hypothetical protein [Acidobacteriota bacterium]